MYKMLDSSGTVAKNDVV